MRAPLLLALVAACSSVAPSASRSAAPPAGPLGDDHAVDPPPDTIDVSPPVARTSDTVEELFGVRVADPYRWMEGKENRERDDWMRAHGAHAKAWFARVPKRPELLARIRELGGDVESSSDVQVAGGRVFFFHTAAGASLPVLKVREPDGAERMLVDPAIVVGASHASLNSYSVSPDGELLAYNISTGGSEISSIKLITVDTGASLPDEIPRVWGQFPAYWLPDARGFFYTQMIEPPPGGDPLQNMKARLHMLGDAGGDVDVLASDKAPKLPIAPQEFPIVAVEPGTAWAVAYGVGARAESRVAVAKLAAVDRSGRAATAWQVVAGYEDEVSAAFVRGERLYLMSFEDAPNAELVSVPLAKPVLSAARVEVAEQPEARLTATGNARDALYYVTTSAGGSTLYRRPWKSTRATVIELPYVGVIRGLTVDPLGDGVVFSLSSWVRPNAYFAYDPRSKQVAAIGLDTKSAADFSGIITEVVEATSADGTRVPMSILRRGDLALDGSRPAVIIGYGGYGIPIEPSFSATRLAWLERGGVIAYAHVRGGGEKGRRWYFEGKGAKKANGVSDLIACAEHLVGKGYAARGKLAVEGASMGGVLVGMAIARRPELFAAANFHVGEVNPLRVLHADNGANQKAELGDPETEEGFKQILAMDPYQHIRDGTAYPATLFTVGLNDVRVAAWMSAKMAARMLAASSSGKPVLLRVDSEAGHGIGSTREQVFQELADRWSFFLAAAGEPGFALPE